MIFSDRFIVVSPYPFTDSFRRILILSDCGSYLPGSNSADCFRRESLFRFAKRDYSTGSGSCKEKKGQNPVFAEKNLIKSTTCHIIEAFRTFIKSSDFIPNFKSKAYSPQISLKIKLPDESRKEILGLFSGFRNALARFPPKSPNPKKGTDIAAPFL